MRSTRRLALTVGIGLLAIGLTGTGLHAAQMGPAKTEKTAKGTILVSTAGMTLYSFDKDKPGMSACTGRCAEFWPPLMAAADAKAGDGFSLVKRDDGSMQWAYDDKPLYLFVGDKKAGEMTGDGKNGVWHVVTVSQ